MKKIILSAIAVLTLVACSNEKSMTPQERNMSAQRYFNENFTVSRINIDGHAFYFIEYGSRCSPSYRYTIAHDDADCKKCFATFD